MEVESIILNNMMFYNDLGLRPYMVKIGLAAFIALLFGHVIGYYIFERNNELKIPKGLEYMGYILVTIFISLLTNDNITPFIYFQF
jgi:fructose-specific phosphotransferase system IIC component